VVECVWGLEAQSAQFIQKTSFFVPIPSFKAFMDRPENSGQALRGCLWRGPPAALRGTPSPFSRGVTPS